MSSTLTIAIYNRLVGVETLTGDYLALQQTLAGLLGTDSDTGLPSVHKGNSSDVVDYPAITFRENAGVVDRRFTLGNTAVGLVVVNQPVYDFETWGKTRLGTELSDIDDAFTRLMDRRYGAPPLPIPNGVVDLSITFVTPTALYDSQRKAWCLLHRVQFKERLFA